MSEAILKREAILFIKLFQDGIKNREFGLEKLKDGTIQQKKYMNYKKPETPLYGMGLELERKTYINILKIKKLKKGYKIYPSSEKHHKSKLTLRELFIIHEQGRTIKSKNGLIKIPARPAFRKTYNIFKNKILLLRKKSYKDIKESINKFVKNKQIDGINKIIRSIPKDKKYDD
jgi:hypothetical protein